MPDPSEPFAAVQDWQRPDPLPNYRNPPVVETVLSVQFEPLSGLRTAHLGAFWKTLDAGEWPAVSDAPPLQPQFERFTESARWAKAAVEVKLSRDLPARVQIRNRATDRMIQLQNGRVHFNWLGQHGGDYPRYANVREGLAWTLERFLAFIAQENLGEFQPNQWEVTYLNHIPKGTLWNGPADWGFFRPLGAVPTIEGLLQAESFGGEWHFLIPPQRGRLHVQWQHGMKSEPEEQEIIVLTLTARGPIQKRDDVMGAILEGLDLGRETIVRSFERFVTDRANKHWGLEP